MTDRRNRDRRNRDRRNRDRRNRDQVRRKARADKAQIRAIEWRDNFSDFCNRQHRSR